MNQRPHQPPLQRQTHSPTIAVLIPCHNEQEMIHHSVDSCLAQTDKPDQIVVVDDGSTDKSFEILSRYGDAITVVRTAHATGAKSKAQQFGLQYIKTDIVITTDADTILDSSFVAHTRDIFIREPDCAALAGSVVSLKHNYLTALRAIDYTIGCSIHKRAQAVLDYVLVIPGCAGVFRTDLFTSGTIQFEHDTLTEDLDFTYKLYRMGKKIRYVPKLISYTQDPFTLYSYINQMRRWYSGGWQNLLKHWRVLRQPRAAFNITLNYMESMLFSVVLVALPLINVNLFWDTLIFYLAGSVAMGVYASILTRRIDLIVWSPLLIPLNVLNSYIFIEQFVEEMIFLHHKTEWFKPERSELDVKHAPNALPQHNI
jgi:N-acetylglucosaminyltransferase